eukprot:scaffold144699_cov15-Tisochrysis_lutea.AAC.1
MPRDAEKNKLPICYRYNYRPGWCLHPASTFWFYVSPACFVFLCFPFVLLELPKMMNDERLVIQPALLLGSALTAFGTQLILACLLARQM